jgi:hypothetical protein
MTKPLVLMVFIATVAAAGSSAEAQGRRGMGTGMSGKRACTYQVCHDRCIARGGPPRGGSKTTLSCNRFCARRCSQ